MEQPEEKKPRAKKTNVLLITSDQQHWMTLGINNPEIHTPNLDRLASEGTYFSRAYTVNPTCTPTRATLITGKYPSQHGAWTLGTKLPESEHTVGEDFQQGGYRTALVGKAHFQPLAGTAKYPSLEAYPILQDLEFWKNFKEKFYGFETVKLARNHTNEAHVGQHYAIWLEEKGCRNWREYFLAPTGHMDPTKKRVWDIPEEYHYDVWIAEQTNALLEQYKANGENFFLWSSFFDPHPAYLVPEPWASMYDPEKITLPHVTEGEHDGNSPFHRLAMMEKPDTSMYRKSGFGLHGVHSHLHNDAELRKNIAVYYGMVSMMDHYIGVILDKLEELGLAENTLVVFTTDHGHLYGQHGLIAKGPFMYEDLIRVPLMARLPGRIPAGRRSEAIQSLVDIVPTFLDFCDLPYPDGLSGLSEKPVWTGEKTEVRRWAICEHNHERDSVDLRTYVNGRYKITLYLGMECGDLYDLEEDPAEIHNRWWDPAYAEIKAQLMFAFLQAEMEREPRFMPRIAMA